MASTMSRSKLAPQPICTARSSILGKKRYIKGQTINVATKDLEVKKCSFYAFCAPLPCNIGHWARQLTLILSMGRTKSKTNSQSCTSLPLTLLLLQYKSALVARTLVARWHHNHNCLFLHLIAFLGTSQWLAYPKPRNEDVHQGRSLPARPRPTAGGGRWLWQTKHGKAGLDAYD